MIKFMGIDKDRTMESVSLTLDNLPKVYTVFLNLSEAPSARWIKLFKENISNNRQVFGNLLLLSKMQIVDNIIKISRTNIKQILPQMLCLSRAATLANWESSEPSDGKLISTEIEEANKEIERINNNLRR